MERLTIYTFPSPILKRKVQPVVNIDGKLQQIIEAMAQTMYQAKGLGLAAPQVGIDARFFIYDVREKDAPNQLSVLINPRIVEAEGEIISSNEGCLSVPDYRSDVKRFERILVEGVDRNGTPLRFELEGLPAIVMQHEIDHLEGILFIDRISALKRNLYKNRILKKLKRESAGG
uniref:Peptide deformylase n=1 Tax=Desulfatirhabdium butyrativorans TaxID=340467 RepID=A0A7C4VQZ0_9BACT